MTDRRKYLILMGAIVAAFVGALLLALPGSPIHKKPVLGLDLQGGLEVVLKAVPGKGHVLDVVRHGQVGLDHAEPDQQARRVRAGDPEAGQRPDRHPARRRPRPGRRRRADRQDGAADALRLRERPDRAVDATSTAIPSRRRRCTACSRRCRSRRRRARRRSTTSSRRRRRHATRRRSRASQVGKPDEDDRQALARRGARQHAAGAPPAVRRHAAAGHEGPRGARRTTSSSSCPVANGCLGVRQGQVVDLGHLLLPDEVRPERTRSSRCRR